MKIEDKVIKIISKVFEIDENQIGLESEADNIESWDSIGHLRFIMELEEEFNVKFLTSQIREMASVKKCINALSEKLDN